MEIALGKMQMRSSDFWDMSLQEFYAALNGFAEFHSSGKPPPMSRNELEALMELHPD